MDCVNMFMDLPFGWSMLIRQGRHFGGCPGRQEGISYAGLAQRIRRKSLCHKAIRHLSSCNPPRILILAPPQDGCDHIFSTFLKNGRIM
jgi:hypothetical protein